MLGDKNIDFFYKWKYFLYTLILESFFSTYGRMALRSQIKSSHDTRVKSLKYPHSVTSFVSGSVSSSRRSARRSRVLYRVVLRKSEGVTQCRLHFPGPPLKTRNVAAATTLTFRFDIVDLTDPVFLEFSIYIDGPVCPNMFDQTSFALFTPHFKNCLTKLVWSNNFGICTTHKICLTKQYWPCSHRHWYCLSKLV